MDERDDEIKQLNEVILNAKCHAIRDAQLQEKDEIKKAIEEEQVYQLLLMATVYIIIMIVCITIATS